VVVVLCFFFSSRRRHTISTRDWSSDVCSSDLLGIPRENIRIIGPGCSYPSNQRVPLEMRSQKLIGCVSRLMHYKGLQFAIEAIRSEERRVGKECRSRREQSQPTNTGATRD